MSATDDLFPLPDQPLISEGNKTFSQKTSKLYIWVRTKLVPALVEISNLIRDQVTGAFTATSSSDMNLAEGEQTIIADAGRSFAVGTPLRVALRTDPGKYVDGFAKNYNKVTGELIFNGVVAIGAGNYDDWSISILPSGNSLASKASNKFTGLQVGANEVEVESANIIDLTDADTNQVVIIGIEPITGATMPQGALISGRAGDEFTLVNSTTFKVQGNKNYKCVVGDMLTFYKNSNSEVHVFIDTFKGIPASGYKSALNDPNFNSTSDEDAPTVKWTRGLITALGLIGKVKSFPNSLAETRNGTAVLTATGEIIQVGNNEYGEIANGQSTGQSDAWIAAMKNIPNSSGVKKFLRSLSSLYVLFNNGEVYTAGYNGYGQLGHGDTANKTLLTRVEFFITNNLTISDIFLGADRYAMRDAFFCLTETGLVYACGANTYGGLGVNNASVQSTPTIISGSFGPVKKIVSSGISSFLLLEDGSLYGSGYNGHGQLGVGDTAQKNVFTNTTQTDVKDIFLRDGFSGPSSWAATNAAFALKNNGDLFAAGYNGYGLLGQGNTTNLNVFTKIAALSNIVGFTYIGGSYYGPVCAWNAAGELYAWGYNGNGGIGDGLAVTRTTPWKVVGWAEDTVGAPPFQGKIAKVLGAGGSIGHSGCLILDTDGNLWATGYDTVGALGTGKAAVCTRYTRVPLPTLLPGEKIVDTWAAGLDGVRNSFLLTNYGRMFGTGSNSVAQVGNIAARSTPAFYTFQPVNIGQ